MEEIVAEAGLSKGAIYWHFESKKALFVDLVTEWFARSAEIAAGVLAAAGAPGRPALRAALRAAAADLAGRREEMPILLEFWAEALRDPDLRDLYNRIYGGMRAAWLGLIGGGEGPGTAGPAEAAVLVGAVSGIFVQWLADPEAFRLEDAIDAVFAIADRPRG